MYPEEDLEDSMNFIEKITIMTSRSPSVNIFLADLLNNIRNDCETEFIYPKLTECLKIVTDRYSSYYVMNFKLSEGQIKLLVASLCLSGKDSFLKRFDEIISLILLRIRERIYSNDSILIISEMLSTYYNRYTDAWATLLDRTESILLEIFPIGRKNVLGCEDGEVGRIVKILEIVSKKLPRFCYNEIIKKLMKQCHQSLNNNQLLDNFPWDRANIALQTFLHLCSGKEWKSEYSKVKIGDLELEPMGKEVNELILQVLLKISKQFWKGHLNQFIFDSSQTKLISFLKVIFEKYLVFIDSSIILKFSESNISELSEKALKAFKIKAAKSQSNESEVARIIHMIGNMIFGQSFKLSDDDEDDERFKVISNAENEKVYEFFETSFNKNFKLIPNPPENLHENLVLRGGIYFILESLTSWSQTKLLDHQLNEKEIELFGRVVDVYFKLLVQYETLVKTVYLEKQNDKNIILRSWSSMVGFKRNSKEIADFLVSLLGNSDERLRSRIIESFCNLPSNRFYEFMKLFEKFRLAVSEDFVNLRRNRRNEKSKIEIARVYKNVLKSLNHSHELPNLTPLRMILRHIIEVYYYVSKNEIIDEFIWILREEFCGLLKEYLRIINSMQFISRKSFLPLKFHLEVWLTIDEWVNNEEVPFQCIGEIEGLFVNFAFNLIEAVSIVDTSTLPKFIDNLLLKISNITSDSNLKSIYVYNIMKNVSDPKTSEMVFLKFIEFIGNGKDFDEKIMEGIQLILLENSNFINGPALDLFFLMKKGENDELSNSFDLKGVLEIFHLVSDAKIQKRILSKIKKFTELNFDETIVEILFTLTSKLIETFPDSLKIIWNSTTSLNYNGNLSLTLHHLQNLLQNNQNDFLLEISKFIYESIGSEGEKEKIILRYAHPFSGTRKSAGRFSPIEATMRLIPYKKDNPVINVIYKLFKPEVCETPVDPEELIKWAVGCPISKISYSAWKELKNQTSNLSNEFVSKLSKKAKIFLQHLVCPSTFDYFDPELVKEILELFALCIKNCDDMTMETFDQVFDIILIQLSARDTIILETVCRLIIDLLPKIPIEKVPNRLYYELSRIPSISIDLLYSLLRTVKERDYEDDLLEKYSSFLIGIAPYLFRLFEESLNVSEDPIDPNQDYSAEIEYLRLLGHLNQKIIITEMPGNENGIICLLELNDFLGSISKMKKRPSIDFYKTFVSILCSEKLISSLISKLIFDHLEIDSKWDQFLIYYFDSLRFKGINLQDEKASFRIANILASSSGDNCPVRQRVIDYLVSG